MKIGILTYYNAVNYGAVLQAYALQSVILNMGHDCEIINYPCPAVEKQYRRKKFSECKHLKTYIKDIISLHRIDNKKAAFKEFRDTYMHLSAEMPRITSDSLSGYDVIIVGSDQVFNPKNTEGDSAFLLDVICRAKKIAYAASIGNNDFLDLWKSKYNVDYISLLNKFDTMSFREKQASEYVSNLLGKSFPNAVDPVLLAKREIWSEFEKGKDEDYIFVYNLGNLPLLKKVVDLANKQTGLKVYVVNKDIKGDFMFRKYTDVSSLSPGDFLRMAANSKYVITDSFHGTAFSAIFHKNFYSVVDTSAGNTNSRIYSILNEIGLKERIVTDINEFDFIDIPDYENVDVKIRNMREKSHEWLESAINA